MKEKIRVKLRDKQMFKIQIKMHKYYKVNCWYFRELYKLYSSNKSSTNMFPYKNM